MILELFFMCFVTKCSHNIIRTLLVSSFNLGGNIGVVKIIGAVKVSECGLLFQKIIGAVKVSDYGLLFQRIY